MLFYMVGVQQLLCFFTQRFFQEVLIKLLYIRIVVGLAHRTVAVDGIELIAQYIGTLFAVMNRLTAAANAAAGAGHNFHEVIMNLACLQLVEQLACRCAVLRRQG